MDPSSSSLAGLNPSYQNYLAKQMLHEHLSSSSSSSSSSAVASASAPAAVEEGDSSSRLDSLLDQIDSKKKRMAHEMSSSSSSSSSSHPYSSSSSSSSYPSSSSSSSSTASAATSSVSSPYDWSKQFDPASSMPYYYNHRTGVSQWEQPEGFIDYHVPPPLPASNMYPASTDAPVVTSTFNAKTGSFAGAGQDSYWAKMGRASDREGRQLSAFFDLNNLDENRAEAQRKKEELKKKKIDWRKYKEESKARRKRLKHAWLYTEQC